MPPIDLRSDTVTRPSEAMRQAMARAEVGDDVYGEDPSVRRLQDRVAELLGKEEALFVPTGTMANQLALKTSTEPGDEVVIGERAHCAWFESGAAAALSGVQFAVAGAGGLFDAAELRAAVKPQHYYYPRTRLVALENTHNAAGGRVFPQTQVLEVTTCARELQLRTHLDGARLWNASVATSLDVGTLAAPFDTVSVCFSKGLGAPVGSALAGPRAQIEHAHRWRKMLGGGMRQAGILAAGALYALEHQRSHLEQDHANAQHLASKLGQVAEVVTPETNIVNVELSWDGADVVVARAAEAQVLLNPMGPRRLRLVTHLDVSREQVQRGAEIVARLIQELSP